MPTPREQKIINKLIDMTVDEARQAIANAQFGHKGSQDHGFASAWLDAKEDSLRDAREDSTIAIAKEATEIAKATSDVARKQARWAMWAVIIATIASIIAVMAYIKAP